MRKLFFEGITDCLPGKIKNGYSPGVVIAKQ